MQDVRRKTFLNNGLTPWGQTKSWPREGPCWAEHAYEEGSVSAAANYWPQSCGKMRGLLVPLMDTRRLMEIQRCDLLRWARRRDRDDF